VRHPQIGFRSVRTRRLVLEAIAPAVLAVCEALDVEVTRQQAAQDTVQATKEAEVAAATALAARLASATISGGPLAKAGSPGLRLWPSAVPHEYIWNKIK